MHAGLRVVSSPNPKAGSSPNPKEAGPHPSKSVPPAVDDGVAAADALTKLIQDTVRPPLDRPSAEGADFAAGPRIAVPAGALPPPTHERAPGGLALESAWDPKVDPKVNPKIDPKVEPKVEPDWGPNWESTSGDRRLGVSIVRYLVAICIGIAATLAWQSYGGSARELIATHVPALAWLASPDATQPAATSEPAVVVPSAVPAQDAAQGFAQGSVQGSAPTRPTPDPSASAEIADDIKAMARDLAGLRRSVDQLTAGQEQVSHTIAKLQAAEDEMRTKLATPPAHKPAAPKPPNPAAPGPQVLAPGPRPLSQSFTPAPGPVPLQPPPPPGPMQ
jgi:hypothetical protein